MAKQKPEASDSVNTATESKANPAVADDGYKLTDGGEIVGGWAPQHHEKHSKFSVTETAAKIEKGKVISLAPSVTGTFMPGVAWNKDCYILKDAKDSDGKTYEQLRLPESKGLFNALGRFDFGADLKIVYGGTVTVPDGYAHKWDVYTKTPEKRLLSPRPGALKTMSEEQKDHLAALEAANEELASLAMKVELRQIENKKKQLLLQANNDGVLDAEFENASDDFAFGMNLDPKGKKA